MPSPTHPADNVHIDTVGRSGATSFADLSDLLATRDVATLRARAQQVLDQDPDSGLALEVMGVADFFAGDNVGAQRYFEQATRSKEDQSGPWSKLGILQLGDGNVDAARASLERALAINPEDRYAHQRLGYIYQLEGDTQRATGHYYKGMSGTPENYLGVSVELARLLNSQGEYSETIAILEPRLPLLAERPDAHRLLAKALLESGQVDAARQRYERAVSLDPESTDGRLGLAAALRENGQAEESLRILEALLQDEPDSIPILLEQGSSLMALERREEADSAFTKAITLGADGPTIKRRMAGIYIRAGKLQEAEAIYTDLLATGLNTIEVYSDLAEVQFAQGRADRAMQTLAAGITTYPDQYYLYLRLGSLQASLGLYDKAVENLATAAELAPNNPTVLRAYSLALSRHGELEPAAEVAEAYYRLNEANAMAGVFYASRLQMVDRNDAAEALYRSLLKLQPDSPLVLNNLASLLTDTGELEEAEQLARRANTNLKDNSQLMDTLAWVLHRRGLNAEALPILNQAVALSPELAILHYHRGEVLLELEKQVEANEALERALGLAPNADWAPKARARLAGIQTP